MKYTVNNLENEIKFDFTLAYDEFSVYLGKALDMFNSESEQKYESITEFIEKSEKKDELNYRALNIAMGDAYRKAIEENKVIVISQPRVELGSMVVGGDTAFSIIIDKAPEAVIEKYKGLEIKLDSKTPSVTVEEIERKKAEIAGSMSEFVSVDCKLDMGLMSVIDFEGSVDGVKFEGGSAENYELMIGSGMFIPGFEDQMVGMEKGEVRIVKVRFPDEYTPELAGKDAEFKVTLHDIKKKTEVEINDGLVAKYAEKNKLPMIKTMEDLNRHIREDLYRAKQRQVEEEIASKLENALYNNTKLDLPEKIVEDEVAYQLEAYENQARQYGIELDMMVQIMGAGSVDGLKEQLREAAKKQLSLQLIIDKIIKAEGISVTEEEMEHYYSHMAAARGISIDEAKKQMPKFHLEGHLISSKAMQIVRDSANIIFA